ncbi:MAG TPA: D-glycerate dehydrogenase [Dehalococcoidia bacterium]|nr:D-glycerate dehydrogenase [Dehalococcoidia bacterium]
MAKPKVFVARRMAQEALDMIAQAAEMELWEDELPPPRDVLLQKVRDIDGLLSLLTDKVDAELMDAAPKLRVVSNMAVGFDNIDVPEATRRGIIVGNTPGVLTETTADFAFALIMAAGRRVAEGDRWTRNGKWKTWGPMILLGHDIHHATLGIVGCGRIGLEVAKRARGFDMKVLYYDTVRRKPEEEREFGLEYVPNLHDLLSRADFITVHVPLMPETRHLISTAEFAAMKPTAVFVNTSRGPVVDQKALYQALKSGQIFAAGLDVTDPEPIPMDDPLLTLENVIIAPHIASASVATRTKMALMAAANLIAGLKGEMPPNCVNPEVLKKG